MPHDRAPAIAVTHRAAGVAGDPALGETIVWLSGEHDVSTASSLSATLARAIAHDDADLIVDLGQVQFMGLATIDVLARARDFLAKQSRTLTLRAASPATERLLGLCALSDLIPGGAFARRPDKAGALRTWVEATPLDGSARRGGRPAPDGEGAATSPGVQDLVSQED